MLRWSLSLLFVIFFQIFIADEAIRHFAHIFTSLVVTETYYDIRRYFIIGATTTMLFQRAIATRLRAAILRCYCHYCYAISPCLRCCRPITPSPILLLITITFQPFTWLLVISTPLSLFSHTSMSHSDKPYKPSRSQAEGRRRKEAKKKKKEGRKEGSRRKNRKTRKKKEGRKLEAEGRRRRAIATFIGATWRRERAVMLRPTIVTSPLRHY